MMVPYLSIAFSAPSEEAIICHTQKAEIFLGVIELFGGGGCYISEKKRKSFHDVRLVRKSIMENTRKRLVVKPAAFALFDYELFQ